VPANNNNFNKNINLTHSFLLNDLYQANFTRRK
jgi:hypothetical protein